MGKDPKKLETRFSGVEMVHGARNHLGKYRNEKKPKRFSVFPRSGINLLGIFLQTRHPYFSFKIYLKKIGAKFLGDQFAEKLGFGLQKGVVVLSLS